MSVTPLASSAQFQASPFANLAANMASTELDRTMLVATRACEGECQGRLLAPFTITETTRLQDGDVEDVVPAGLPLPMQSQMGLDYSRALQMPAMVRHAWVRNYPVAHPDLWSGSLTGVSITWSLQMQPFTVDPGQVHFEPDTGHVSFLVGTFVPPGTIGSITYTGGYSTTPDDLVQACLLLAAAQIVRELDPDGVTQHDPQLLRSDARCLLVPYGAASGKV